jgi:type IV pilus assembly protein PilV
MAMNNERGFTLISVLIALVLLSVGMIALSRTGATVVKAHSSAASRTTALAIARGHMEVLRSQDPRKLESESPVRVDDTGAVDTKGAYTRTVTVTGIEHNLVRVELVVEFPRSTRPVELITMAYVPPVSTSATSSS